MKLTLACGVLCLAILQCYAVPVDNKLNFRSPLEKPFYQDVLSKLYPEMMAKKNNRVGRITNGSPAHLGQFPYHVYMYLYEESGNGYLCGGSVIAPTWVLTAAHCVDQIVFVEVHFGSINRFNDGSQGSAIKVIEVSDRNSIIKHEQYDANTIANDIGLVNLPEVVPSYHEYVSYIGLPTGAEINRRLDAEMGTVAGYGRFSDEVASASAYLNWIKLPIASNTLCQNVFGARYVTEKHVCLQNVNNGGTCQGDSGGPLTIVGFFGENVQVGIVSFGAAAGCELGYPDVFTRVDQFLPWIQGKTGIN